MGKDLATQLEPEVPQEEIQAAEAEQQQIEQEASQEPKAEKPVDKATEVQNNLKAAMQEERKKRQEIERQYRQAQEEQSRRNAVLEDRLQQMYGAMQQPQQPQLRDPNSDPDPIAAVSHNQQVTWQAMQELHRQNQYKAAQERQAQQFQQMATWANVQTAEFKKENADYDHAYGHMVKMRAAELEAMGLNVEQIRQTIQQDEMWIIQSAAQTQRNPAEMVYAMAKATGYKGPAAETPTPEQKIETLNKGMAASKDLGNGAPSGKPTAQQIADMSDEEFADFHKKYSKQGKRLTDVL